MLGRTIAITIGAIIVMTTCVCSRRAGSVAVNENNDIKQKLDQVLQEMVRLTDDPAEKRLLGQAEPLGSIKDLDMAVVGFALPQKEKDRRIQVSFALDYFKEHDVKTLAQEALKDWRSAAAEAPLQR